MSELNQEQFTQLNELIADAFNLNSLELLVGLHMGDRLEQIVDSGRPVPNVVFSLIQEYEAHGETHAFVRGAVAMRPNRQDLVDFSKGLFVGVDEPLNPSALVAKTSSALESLVQLVQDPSVRENVGRFKANFETIETRIKVLRRYKTLHELLHVIQQRLPSIVDATRRFPDDMGAVLLLTREVVKLKDIGRHAEETANGLDNPGSELPWIEEFRETVRMIDKALSEQSVDDLSDGIEELRRYLKEAARIDALMVHEVSLLPLSKLIEALGLIEGAEVPESIRHGRAALSLLTPRLRGLVNEHTVWQRLDQSLSGIESNPGHKPSQKVHKWDRQKEKLEQLCGAFPTSLWPNSDIVRTTITDWESAADAGEMSKSLILADTLHAHCMGRFFEVDGEMKSLCENLVDIGKPLRTLLDVL